MRTKKSTLIKITLMVCLGQLAPVYGAAPTFTWTATAPASDLNGPSNWNPSGPPVSGDLAYFNSTLPGVDVNPFAVLPFNTGELNFLVSARPFQFTFADTSLNFGGLSMVGITGASRDPKITIYNNNSLLLNQLTLNGGVSDSFGSAQITVTNSAIDFSNSGVTQVQSSGPVALFDSGASLVVDNTATTTMNGIVYQLSDQATFNEIEALDFVTLSVTNTNACGDNTTGDMLGVSTGDQIFATNFRAHDSLNLSVTNSGQSGLNSNGNSAGVIVDSQVESIGLFTIGNNGTINVSNSGINNGSTNIVGQLGAQQFASGPFTSGDGLVLNVVNLGNNTVNASGTVSFVGTIPADQMAVYSFTTGDNSLLTFTNTGINNSIGANANFVGTCGDAAQFLVGTGPFLAGDNLQLVAINSGADGSNGPGGNFVGLANGQIACNSIFTTGDNAFIKLSNSGSINGSTGGSSQVAALNNGSQWDTSSGTFNAGDWLTFCVSNFGQNNDPGGNNSVASVIQNQAIFSSIAVGDGACFTFTNSGVNTQGSTSAVGGVGTQCDVNTLSAKDWFYLSASNQASDSSLGTTTNTVGGIGDQFISKSTIVKDNATFNLCNSASNTGSVNSSFIGNFSSQLSASSFIAGDGLTLTLSNTSNSTSGSGGNFVGNGSNSLNLGLFEAGDGASISISNTATQANGSNDFVGNLANIFFAGGRFIVGDDFSLSAANSGTQTGSGSTNFVGSASNLVRFNSSVTLGKDASINISNSGSYTGLNAASFVGSVNEQFYCAGPFSAEENLSLVVTNTAENPNFLPNVGAVMGQINFAGNAVFNDGTLIKAVNSGIVNANQMFFQQPFNVLGKVTFEAINTGTAFMGINVSNAVGGDIAIVLQDTTLFVDNSGIGVPFTLGSLTGDKNSTATSANFGFIFDTDFGVDSTFAGTLNISRLVKDGLGSQTLSGTTNATAVSLVNQGILNVTGIFNGDIETRGSGILTGDGTLNGTVYDSGIVLPDLILTVNNFITSGSGILQANVTAQDGNGLLNVQTNTTLNGGQVVVGTFDGTYRFYNPYTILVSGNAITGAFDSISALSPMIDPEITYFSNAIQVTLKQNISAAAFTHNQRAAASVLDATTDPTLAQSLLLSQLVDLSISEASRALDSLAGVEYANETFFNETINRQFIRRLYDPLRFIVACNPCYYPCGKNFNTWLEVGGDFTTLDRIHTLNGYQVTGGAHLRINRKLLIGGAVSYEGDTISYGHHSGWQTKHTGMGGLYGLFRDRCFYLLADVAYGNTQSSLRREAHIGSATHKTKSHPNQSQVTFYGESGIDIPIRDLKVQPFAGLEVNSYWRDHLTETGSDGFALHVHHRDRTAAYTRLGLHLTSCCNYPFRASLDVAWDYRCTELDNRSVNEFIGFNGDFDIIGKRIARNSFDYALTIEKDLTSRWSAYVETTGQIYNRATTFTVLGGLSVRW